MTDWVEDARVTPFPHVAASLGMAEKAKRWGPCPACGAASTRNDRRPPVGRVNGKGWICNACREGGDVLDLVSFALHGVRASKAGRSFKRIGLWFGDKEEAVTAGEERKVERLAPEELTPLLMASTPAHRSRDFAVVRFLAERGYRQPPAWVLPEGWSAPWWPWREFPLVVPAFNGHGVLMGLHGRAVDPLAKRKTTWPLDRDSRGLLMADPRLGLPLLREGRKTRRALIVEGITDYLCAAEDQAGKSAVLGIASGSASALRLVNFTGMEVFVATDDDPAGRRYAERVAEAVAPAPCRTLPLALAK